MKDANKLTTKTLNGNKQKITSTHKARKRIRRNTSEEHQDKLL